MAATPEEIRDAARILFDEFLKAERRRRKLAQLKDLINSYPDEAVEILAEFRERKAHDGGEGQGQPKG